MAVKTKTYGQMPESDHVSVGIDPSLTGFGICIYHPTGHYAEVWTPETRGAERLAELRSRLVSTFGARLGQYVVSDVAIEGTVRQSASASVLGELSGVVKECLYTSFGTLPLIVPPMSLKKYVVGVGNQVTKSRMLLSVYKKWGAEFSDDNAADAYGLSRIAYGAADTAYEKQVIDKLDDPKFRA